MSKAKAILIVGFLIFFGALASVIFYFHYEASHPNTDDAYVEAASINVSAEVNGNLVHLNVENGQYVHKGELLFEVDPKPYLIALQAAEAQALLAKKSLDSIAPLAQQKYLPQIEKDKAQAALQAAQASLEAAKMNVHHTRYYAPFDGYVANLHAYQGSLIGVGEPLFVLINKSQYWVLAHFKETQLLNIKLNQPAEIMVDMYHDKKFKGKVVSIGYGSGSAFSLLPSQNATGNWVKIAQRFPVRIEFVDLPKDAVFRVGASCSVKITA
ncbi:MAG: emrA [Gammaproteobacteria bacterium]|jgi:membrane fusion protein (multidrug efflux system)|nr:emrA [Gammaproteobacteria bacterium]